MAALLVWKVTVPFVAVSTALWAITVENQVGYFTFLAGWQNRR